MSSDQSKMNTDTIMTLAEVSKFLKIGERTVLKMVHCEEIPAIRIGNQWRFMRAAIDDWLNAKMPLASRDDLSRLIELDETAVPLSRLIVPLYTNLAIQPGSVEDVLDQLTRPFLEAGDIDADVHRRLVEELLYRENILSTAIDNGVAFPHFRTPTDNPIPGPLIQVGRCDAGTDFRSQNGKPTFIFFFTCTSSITVHLRITSRLAQAVANFGLTERILNAQDGEGVLAALLEIGI